MEDYLDGKTYKWKTCRWKIFNNLTLMIICMENILKLFNKHMEQNITTRNNLNETTIELEYMLAVE